MYRLPRSIAKSLIALAALTAAAPAAFAQRAQPAPAPAKAPEHTNQLVAESKSKPLCEGVANRVFVQHDQGSECIAYFASTGTPEARPAVFYFEGDVPAGDLLKPNFERDYLNEVRTVFQNLANQARVRFTIARLESLNQTSQGLTTTFTRYRNYITSRQTSPSSSMRRAVPSTSSVQSAKCGYRATIFSRSVAGRTS